MTAVEVLAPAKVNLTLHVTGRRADGYHLLDSLVAFAGAGDRVTVAPAPAPSLRVTGPRAGSVPAGADNLVLRAAALMGVCATITLEKHLPAASGIGGGSSDAAATLRALARLTGRPLPEALTLGADLPVCLIARAARMRGIGETVEPLPSLPALDAVLVNPGLPVATPAVFARLARRDNPAMPATLPHWPDAAALIGWLATQRNDLEEPAVALCPAIGTVLAALRDGTRAALTRMSGSGATCFGLYPDAGTARAAAAEIAAQHPGWWVAATRLS